MAIFTGSGVAIVTPMKENQDVNYEKLEELLEFCTYEMFVPEEIIFLRKLRK